MFFIYFFFFKIVWTWSSASDFENVSCKKNSIELFLNLYYNITWSIKKNSIEFFLNLCYNITWSIKKITEPQSQIITWPLQEKSTSNTWDYLPMQLKDSSQIKCGISSHTVFPLQGFDTISFAFGNRTKCWEFRHNYLINHYDLTLRR